MSIWKSTTRLVVLVALLGGAGRLGAAQGQCNLEEKTPLVTRALPVGWEARSQSCPEHGASRIELD